LFYNPTKIKFNYRKQKGVVLNPINYLIVQSVKILPKSFIYLFAKKYIAGTNIADGIKVTRELNSNGIAATMDVLGESVSNREDAIQAKNDFLELLETIEKEKLDSNISTKPTALGLLIDKELCYDLFVEIVECAKKYNNFVRIDMEESSVTDDIFELYEKLFERYSNVGIVVQSYMRRNIDDIKRLNARGANYRICKGIYIEPKEIAFKDKNEVRDKFLEALELMFNDGNYVGIATHDNLLVKGAYDLIIKKNIPHNKLEFQMLYGVKEKLRKKIKDDGYKMRIYVPYGDQWYAYSVRRLQENPQLAWYIIKSITPFK